MQQFLHLLNSWHLTVLPKNSGNSSSRNLKKNVLFVQKCNNRIKLHIVSIYIVCKTF